MQGDGQLDHAQSGTEMPAGLPDRVQQILAQLIGQTIKLGLSQPAQAVRRAGTVQ